MKGIVSILWIVPLLPLAAAGVTSLLKQPWRRLSSALAIGAMSGAFLLSIGAFAATLSHPDGHGVFREVCNFPWLETGGHTVMLGWILDPLTAGMLVMVTFVSLLIFIYSTGYMERDENYTRFFCFLSLFAAAMLGLVIANSLLLLFICWELVGLASYLLIGFWFQKPGAAAAAKKAFIVTRVGDIGLFLGMLWLYSETGTLLFYDQGSGCIEPSALSRMVSATTIEGMAVTTAIGLLLFCGAAGKSGQLPLHVWLPDAMEGPTPVSALIHAATMVAAGVFLMARVYPLLESDPGRLEGISTVLMVIAWVGAATALFAACVATAQTDIKRILAYSTVSQLGYMMLGIGVGGVAVGVFHLIAHAFFKALLFLGAGSVIHGCHEEQDIRRMGGLRRAMPKTFAAYAAGMMALAGFPVFFSGFWSKDDILRAAFSWPISTGPFYMALAGAFLTAFYMTRQMACVFWGPYRGQKVRPQHGKHAFKATEHGSLKNADVHESPASMVVPLQILAACSVLLGFLGTPAWPWFHRYLTGHSDGFDLTRIFKGDVFGIMALSTLAVALGVAAGYALYGKNSIQKAGDDDPLESMQPEAYGVLRRKLFVDEIYDATVVRAIAIAGAFANWLDRFLLEGCVSLLSWAALGLAWFNRLFDEFGVNFGFDAGCGRIQDAANGASQMHNGRIGVSLRILAAALAGLVLLLSWGGRP
jgi:NADH-quinone oxidoreductase subunit L